MSDLEQIAYKIAYEAHAKQFRRDGVTPYITHPVEVANRVRKMGSEYVAAALLHDVLEDDPTISETYLRYMLGSDTVTDAVVALTKREYDEYTTYIERVYANPIARAVKIADIMHNLSASPKETSIHKYAKALARLTN